MRTGWLGLLAFASVLLPIPPVHVPATPSAAHRKLTIGASAAIKQRVTDQYGRLPLAFEKNQGQTDPRVDFLSRGPGYALFLLDGGETVLSLGADADAQRAAAVRLKPVGARPSRAEGREALPGAANYFTGADRKHWRTGIPTYARVTYTDIYPGIDLTYYGNNRQLEYDLVVRPGADPGAITFEAQGADRLEVDRRGDLILHVGTRHVRQQKPIVYQEARGVRYEREGRYVLKGSNRVKFQLGRFDPTQPLVIDPVLVYSTFLGGVHYIGSGADDYAYDVALDAAGYAYLTGSTVASDFPTTAGAFDSTFNGTTNGSPDVFITKLAPDGATLAYSTYVGGRGDDEGRSIAIDSAGQAYVTGMTTSRDLPTTAGAFDRTFNGGDDAFVMKLDAAGGRLVFSTFLGGTDIDVGKDITVDDSGQAYVVGTTRSMNFPTTAGAYDRTWNDGGTALEIDAFVAKLDAAGATLVYSTFLGGANSEDGTGIAIDSVGRAYVTGETVSADFPTTAGAYDVSYNGGGGDVFVTRLDATGASLSYSTFLGGTSRESGEGIAIDGAGNAYVTGATSSIDFPSTPGAYQTGIAAGQDAFVTKLDSTGGTLVYSTYVGGVAQDIGHRIVVDTAGQAYVTGDTTGAGFPTTPGAYDSTYEGIRGDGFAMKLGADGSTLLYATYLGGADQELTFGLAIDPAGNAYIAGATASSNYPTTPGAYDPTPNGGRDAFLTRLNAAGSALVYSTFVGGNVQAGGDNAGFALAVDNAGSAYVTGMTTAPDFPTTTGAYDVSLGGSSDVFVTKLDPSGSSLVYSTFLGGSGFDVGNGIAVDGAGNAYVTGLTQSDFPTTAGAYDTTPNGNQDVFLAKLDPSGTALVYSTLLGGSSFDYPEAVAVDGNGQAYVTGYTGSIDFPTTAGAYDTTFNSGHEDAFVTMLNAAGTMLVYSTFLGGSSSDVPTAIGVDAGGSAYVTGHTFSSDFPATAGAYDTTFNGGADAFVTKLDPGGATLAYSTFLGGESRDSGEGLAVDAAGSTYVTGMTASLGFPKTPGAYDTTLQGPSDVFVTKLDAAGAALVYSTLLGGSAIESGTAVAVDSSGNAYVTGATASSDFPTTAGAFDASWNLDADAFLAKIDAAGATLLYSTFLGGTRSDMAYGVAVDPANNVYVMGETISGRTFPTTEGAYDTTAAGPSANSQVFVAKFSDVGPARPRVIITANGTFGPLTLTAGDSLAIDVSFDAAGGVIDPGEVYIGVYTPQGVLWLDKTSQKFIPTPRPVYSGALASFGPQRVVTLANVATLATGQYMWFMAVDHDSNGQPDLTYFDNVLVVVQ